MDNNKANAGWNFDNTYAQLPETFFSTLHPIPVSAPQLVILNKPLATSLGLDEQALESADQVAVFAGNQVPAGALPLAQAYAGHQFGHFTMLGDGRAHLLGEQLTPNNERFDIQLKGSGRTPYSRRGDGRATLGPMLREYIISEAMHALNIPTTRSLAVVTTGETVMRETALPGAILTRVAASHLRVGTFQYAATFGKEEELRTLADYTLQRHFTAETKEVENPYLFLLQQVIKRQAKLIAKWQLIGFIHGVMNTDNMTISGETIDYGPCAFMDSYDPTTVFSSIDTQGRYAYGKQPNIAGWNLARLAETLLPLLHEEQEQAIKIAQEALLQFAELYHHNWLSGMRAKLGLFTAEAEDEALIEKLLSLMEQDGADFTNTFRALTIDKLEGMELFDAAEFSEWHKRWLERQGRQQQTAEDARRLMQQSNPGIIPRNHRVEEALNAAVHNKDYSVMERLLSALAKPYAYLPEHNEYCEPAAPSSRPYQTFCGT